jgi:hypothetical protein
MDDFFGIEDLLDQAYEDAVYAALIATAEMHALTQRAAGLVEIANRGTYTLARAWSAA